MRAPGAGEKIACPGVATRKGRRQKPRFLPPQPKLMSEKIAAGDFFQWIKNRAAPVPPTAMSFSG
jgi:hypothetical protein